MPDIALRFDKDMLVVSAPVSAALSRQGVDVDRDLELMTVLEPDSIQEAMRLESMAGAQCLATSTAGITPARMAQVGMEDRAHDVARASLEVLRPLKPQHVLVEIGPCGLPLDASSKASLNENRDQYARAARLFAGEQFDAFFLNGFTTASDLLCALMGVRQVSDMPAFASVDVLADGTLASGRGTLEEACAIMGEYGASVAGFSTACGIEDACALAKRAEAACDLPILVQLEVAEHKPKQGGPTDANPYYCPDAVVDAAVRLRASGVQFLRATGAATPAYTGALAATTAGLDVAACRTAGVPVADASVAAELPSSGDGRSEGEHQVASATDEQMSALADALREKVAAAFNESGGGVGAMSSREKSPYYGSLQQVVDSLFADLTEEERIADMAGVPGARKVRRLDVILAAEAVDLPDELQEIVNLLPPSTFTRRRLCDQLNSAVGGHAWGQKYGTVE